MNQPKTTQPMTKITHFAYGLILCAVGLMILNVFMSARVAQDGLEIDTLAKQESQLKTEITQLEQQLLNSTSLADLSMKADELGYQEPSDVITIAPAQSVAYLDTLAE